MSRIRIHVILPIFLAACLLLASAAAAFADGEEVYEEFTEDGDTAFTRDAAFVARRRVLRMR